jgi:hypothetical protein
MRALIAITLASLGLVTLIRETALSLKTVVRSRLP